MGSNLPAFIPNCLTLTGCLFSFFSLSRANSSYLSNLLVFDLIFRTKKSGCHQLSLSHKLQSSSLLHLYISTVTPLPAVIHPVCFLLLSLASSNTSTARTVSHTFKLHEHAAHFHNASFNCVFRFKENGFL